MRELARRVVASSPDVVLFVSPHGRLFRDAFGVYSRPSFEGNMGKFGQAGISYRAEGFPRLAQAIASASSGAGLPVVFSDQNAPIPLDHGVLVPLHFLREAGYGGKILPLTYSFLDRSSHWRFGEVIAEVLEEFEGRSAIVASGDLSHRLTPDAPAGFTPRGREYDEKILSLLREERYREVCQLDEDLLEEAGECAFRSLLVMLGASPNFKPRFPSYEGPFGVGYATVTFEKMEE